MLVFVIVGVFVVVHVFAFVSCLRFSFFVILCLCLFSIGPSFRLSV